MNKKIEDFFELPQKEKHSTINLPNKTNNDMLPLMPKDLDLNSFDQEMDDIANQAISSFEEIMQRAESTEDRHAGSVYAAASDFLKSALTAKTQKMKARLDAINAQLKMNQQQPPKEEAPSIQLNTRADVLRSFQTQKNENDKNDK
jgi:hypothetical protein